MPNMTKDELKGRAGQLTDDAARLIERSSEAACTPEAHAQMIEGAEKINLAVHHLLDWSTNGMADDIGNAVEKRMVPMLADMEIRLAAQHKAFSLGRWNISNAAYKKLVTAGISLLVLVLPPAFVGPCRKIQSAIEQTSAESDKERTERRAQYLAMQTQQIALMKQLITIGSNGVTRVQP